MKTNKETKFSYSSGDVELSFTLVQDNMKNKKFLEMLNQAVVDTEAHIAGSTVEVKEAPAEEAPL